MDFNNQVARAFTTLLTPGSQLLFNEKHLNHSILQLLYKLIFVNETNVAFLPVVSQSTTAHLAKDRETASKVASVVANVQPQLKRKMLTEQFTQNVIEALTNISTLPLKAVPPHRPPIANVATLFRGASPLHEAVFDHPHGAPKVFGVIATIATAKHANAVYLHKMYLHSPLFKFFTADIREYLSAAEQCCD
jgi:hypothetical protein